jgi:hypothetical protein
MRRLHLGGALAALPLLGLLPAPAPAATLRLVDPSGRPVAGVPVVVWPLAGAVRRPLASGVTDAGGRLAVPAGAARIAVPAAPARYVPDTAATVVVPAVVRPPAAIAAAAARSALGCVETVTTTALAEAPLVVGELHTASDAAETLTYGPLATTIVEVAANEGRGWYDAGSARVVTRRATPATWHAGPETGRYVTTRYRYALEHHAFRAAGGTCLDRDRDTVRAVAWTGGALTGADLRRLDHRCGAAPAANVALFGRGTAFARATGRGAEVRGAANLFGISLWARSDWSSGLVARWAFGRAISTHVLCGVDGPPVTATRVLAGR